MNYLDCSNCKVGPGARRAWHCGRVAESTWIDPGFVRPVGWPAAEERDVCPGHLISLPQVGEAARALVWWDKGLLTTRFRKPTTALMDAVELLQCEASAVESHIMMEAEKRGRHGSA